MADKADSFETFAVPETERTGYRPRAQSHRKWVWIALAVVATVLVAVAVLHGTGVMRLWPEHVGLTEQTVQLKNRHGGAAVVRYYPPISEPEARATGELLVAADSFGGPDGADVMVERHDGIVISFFINPQVEGGPLLARKKPLNQQALDQYETEMKPVRDRISAEVFNGVAVTIELCEREIEVGLEKPKRKVLRRF